MDNILHPELRDRMILLRGMFDINFWMTFLNIH